MYWSTHQVFGSPSPAYEQLYRTLRELRIERGLSQTTMAERLGTFQETVSRIEIGERRIDVIELLAFCRVLDVSLTELLARACIDYD